MSLFIIDINIAGPGVGPSFYMNFFFYLLLCTNFFSWHFPLHEFFFVFFPTPPITFLMVRPLFGTYELIKLMSSRKGKVKSQNPTFLLHGQ